MGNEVAEQSSARSDPGSRPCEARNCRGPLWRDEIRHWPRPKSSVPACPLVIKAHRT